MKWSVRKLSLDILDMFPEVLAKSHGHNTVRLGRVCNGNVPKTPVSPCSSSIFAQSLLPLALTITVLKPMKRGEITEFKIKTGDFNCITSPKNTIRYVFFLIFYCCTVQFDNVHISFHQQMHRLLNI